MGPIPDKKGDFFSPKITSRCPICQIPVSLRDINRHLDAAQCQLQPQSPKEKSPQVVNEEDFEFPDSDSEYEKLSVAQTVTDESTSSQPLKASRSISNHPNRYKIPDPSSSSQVQQSIELSLLTD